MTAAIAIARGLRFEARARKQSPVRTHARIARLVGLRNGREVCALLNPLRRRPPRLAVRVALERLSARWPTCIAAGDWGKR